MNIKQLRAARLADAQAVVDGAKDRDLTDNENETVQGLLAQVKGYDAQIAAAAKSADLVESLGASGRAYGDDSGGGTKAGSLVPLHQLKEMYTLARTGSVATIEVPGRKAFIGSSTAAPIGQPFVGGVYATNGSLLDLFPHRIIEGPSVRVYKTSTVASVPAVTLEGASKPDAGLIISSSDVTVSKIAAVQKISEEALTDFPDFVNAIGVEVAQAIKVRENAWGAALLLGTSGILTSTPAPAVSVVDAVADSIASMESIGVVVNAVAMNPADLSKARKSKASTSGVYNFDPLTPGPTQLWGLTVVSTPSLAANTVLVGDFASAGWVGVRDSLRIELGHSGTDWGDNLRTLRCEERLLLAITTPSKIMKITLS